MSFTASLLVKGDTSNAKAAVKSLAAETDKLKLATGGAGATARKSAADFAHGAGSLADIKNETKHATVAQGLFAEMTDLAAGGLTDLAIGIAIAAGSALVTWLFTSAEQTKALDVAVDDLTGSVAELAKRAKVDLSSLKEDFGAVTPQIVRMNEQLVKLGEVKAIDDIRASIAALKAAAAGSLFAAFNDKALTDLDQAASLLGVAALKTTTGRAAPVANPIVMEFQATLDDLENARGPAAQLAVFERLNAEFVAAAGGIDNMTVAQQTYFAAVVATEKGLRQTVEAQREAERSAQAIARANALENARSDQPLASDRYKYQAPVDLGPARDLLATLEQQNRVQQLINQYGAESVQVTDARAQAERAAFVELVNSGSATEDMKAELLVAFDAGQALASLDMASGIAAAASTAGTLARNLKISLSEASALMAMGYEDAGPVVLDPRDPRYDAGAAARETKLGFTYGTRSPFASTSGSGVRTGDGAGSGATAAREEADAVGDLIAKLQAEYDLLLVVDPAKKEMLRYREDLAEATDAERLQVEALIQAEIELNNARAAGEIFTNLAADFLDQVLGKGQSAIQVIRQLASELLSAAANSFLTGEGGFASIFGIVGDLFAPQAKAGGGMIYGSGGPKADKVPVWSSAGEYIVNAEATSNNRSLLEMINAGGSPPAFANGGIIGGAPRSARGASGGLGDVHINLNLAGANGDAAIHQMVIAGVQAGLQAFQREVLPQRIQYVLRNPREIG